ncbi:NO-inducible flavohemoprotein [Terrilactibacillus sp. BCM23-1]|uniref:Flavohemoprotein n=1 Tax=Terrilactibacillus tamarindi TaxID=2599694 RepID=A0A6N8CP23_9BACI|nr:NO-inducible flavohemoprotein [Terrilactibacillus tamarindi]MTT31909.1 NO-inducible flavohemoprotein [Terrilactibacillus tamarindi]
MDAKTIAIIKSTVPVLESKGEEIIIAFYKHLLETNPELKNVFNQTNQKRLTQPRALAQMVYQAAKNIDQLEALLPSVKLVAEKHRSLGIKPEQYPIVGENLLWAIKHVLKDAATDEIIHAWAEAYGQIADVFISIENGLREEVTKKGGWDDFAPFKVADIKQESSIIKSFYLKPESGQPLPLYQPGQYISIRVRIPGSDYTQIRQYSLSDVPNKDYFRISVKREKGREQYPDGLISNYLHSQIKPGDTLEVSAPAGEFTMKTSDKPIVFISAGIGQTPLLSMVKQVINENPERHITWIHSAKDADKLAFKEELTKLKVKAPQLNVHIALSQDKNEYEDIKRYGRIDSEWLKQLIEDKDSDYYFCGPTTFMHQINQILTGWNVPESQIHYEFFGPKEELTPIG